MAGTTVASMAVALSANTVRFKKGMDSARTSLQRFNRSFRKLKGTMGQTLGVLGVGLGVHRVVGYFKDLAKWGNDVVSMSDKLGVNMERLQDILYAGALSRVEESSIVKAFENLQKNVSQAERIGGDVARAFDVLGVNVRDLMNLTPEDMFERILVAMEGINTQARRMDIYKTIFGRPGAEIALLGGAEGIAQARNELDRFGRVTEENFNALNAIDQAFIKFGTSLRMQTASALAPTAEAAREINDMLQLMADGLAAVIRGWRWAGQAVKESPLFRLFEWATMKYGYAAINAGDVRFGNVGDPSREREDSQALQEIARNTGNDIVVTM